MTTTYVSNNQSLLGDIVTSGNELVVPSGGTTYGTHVESGGFDQVDAWGSGLGTIGSGGGNEFAFGQASATIVDDPFSTIDCPTRGISA